ncbi:hypothetical protein HYFRA_00001819 [Hymenoscyphus fraxineus]|uniref:Uncharacterized protein n=1 Tax=Hymenoscyphus fraxineus TaxID=746836 RepID=A0A9N9PMH9_9HELO|nr:hypothetical protein HYFRA_00001819 [Hymenoscyphus fraxineus]
MDARRTGTSQPAAAPSRRLTIVPIAPERPSFFSSLFSTTKQQFKKLRTMCFPCIPVSNVELEELPAARSAEDRRRSGRASWIMAYDPVTRTNVRVGTCYDPVIIYPDRLDGEVEQVEVIRGSCLFSSGY